MKVIKCQGCEVTVKKVFIINFVTITEHGASSGISGRIQFISPSLTNRDFYQSRLI